MTSDLTATAFADRLAGHADPDRAETMQRRLRPGAGDSFLGVRMGTIFDLAKRFIDLPPAELEAMLDSDIHELRVGALSVMGKQAARRSTPRARVEELYDLYLRRHDRIDSWGLVDLAAHHVVGRHLQDRPRAVLYEHEAAALPPLRRSPLSVSMGKQERERKLSAGPVVHSGA